MRKGLSLIALLSIGLSGCAFAPQSKDLGGEFSEEQNFTRYCRPGSALVYKVEGKNELIPVPAKIHRYGSCLYQ